MNDAELVVQEAQRWLQFSAEDLDVAQRLLADRLSAPRHVCWLSQQAAEKALKAALVLEEIDFPYTHDLNALRNLLPDSWPVRVDYPDLTQLNQWGRGSQISRRVARGYRIGRGPCRVAGPCHARFCSDRVPAARYQRGSERKMK